jgi:inhibitor of cysteine peptidase
VRRSGAAAVILGLILGALPVLAAGPAASPRAPGEEIHQMTTITLTRADAGRTVEVRVGDTIRIRLEENPTTGYRWSLEPAGDDALALEASDYVAPGGTVGGGGERVFTFEAKKAGGATVRLKLWREWEGDKSITETFTITFRVRA